MTGYSPYRLATLVQTAKQRLVLTEHVKSNEEIRRRRRRFILTATRVGVATEPRSQLLDQHHAPRVPQSIFRRARRHADGRCR